MTLVILIKIAKKYKSKLQIHLNFVHGWEIKLETVLASKSHYLYRWARANKSTAAMIITTI